MTRWTAAHQASLSISNSWSLLKLMSIESVMPSNLCHPVICYPLSSPSPTFNPLQHEGLFQGVSRWPKYWSFSFRINPSNEHSGLISFRMDWIDLLAVQGTLKSLLQHHNIKHRFFCGPSSSRCNSHLCITTGKTIALTIRTFVGKVI